MNRPSGVGSQDRLDSLLLYAMERLDEYKGTDSPSI